MRGLLEVVGTGFTARGAAAVVVWLAGVLGAPTQANPDPPDTLRLQDVLEHVYERSAVLRARRATVDRAHAQRLRASAYMDPALQFEAGAGHADASAGATGATEWVRTYRATLVKRTIWGATISPFASFAPGSFVSGAVNSFGASVTVPLLHFGPDNPDALTRRATGLAVQAAETEYRHLLARELFTATIAFWDLLSHQWRVAIATEASTRAEEMLEIVGRLVETGERAESDRTQALAFAAGRQTEVLAAEQPLLDSAARVAVIAEMSTERLVALILDAAPSSGHREARSPGRDSVSLGVALNGRDDLEAARLAMQSESALARAHTVAKRPQLNLNASFGQERGAGAGTLPAQRFVSLGVSMSGFLANRAARSIADEQRARLRESRAVYDRTRSEAEASLYVASRTVTIAREEVRRADAAMKAHRAAVENERRRLSAGFATVFDVIQAEDRLMGAQLATVAARYRLGEAVARLAFVRGGIVKSDSESPEIWADRLLTVEEAEWP